MDHFQAGKYTSMFADTIEYSRENFSRNFERSHIVWLKDIMKEKEFDFIRGIEKWNKIIESDELGKEILPCHKWEGLGKRYFLF